MLNQKRIKDLEKQARKAKYNKHFIIAAMSYFLIGDLYLEDGVITDAIENYKKAREVCKKTEKAVIILRELEEKIKKMEEKYLTINSKCSLCSL